MYFAFAVLVVPVVLRRAVKAFLRCLVVELYNPVAAALRALDY